MPGQKFVIDKPVLTYRPASAAGSGSFTDISIWATNTEMKPMRVTVDVAAYGDGGAKTEKAHRDHKVTFDFFHSKLWSEFSALLETEFAASGDTEFRVKFADAAVSADNPLWWFAIKLHSLGSIGGNRGTAAKLSETYAIEGYLQKSVDGTNWTNV